MYKAIFKLGFIILFTCISFIGSAQIGALYADTVSKYTTDLRRTQSTVVNFEVSKLYPILKSCFEKNVNKVQFIFATIRDQDTTRYFSKHPNVMKDYRRSIIGKPTLILRVPKSAFGMALNDDPLKNRVMRQMVGAGFILLDAPYGSDPKAISGDFYFDLGTVCPPPDNCDDYSF